MQPCLCKKHVREVSNVFDKQVAFAYALDEENCVICKQVIFIEGARRYVVGTHKNASDDSLRTPDSFHQSGS